MGTKWNQERIEAHRKRMIGHPTSETTKLKISLAQRGPNGPNWKGGITHNSEGYRLIKRENHPFKNCMGYVFEHRLVMEEKIGRYLTKHEIVHHINGIKNDNRIENLELMNRAQHISEHKRKRIACVCPNCSKSFERRPCEVKISKNNFCSASCSSQWYMKNGPKRKGLDRTGSHWKEVDGERVIY